MPEDKPIDVDAKAAEKTAEPMSGTSTSKDATQSGGETVSESSKEPQESKAKTEQRTPDPGKMIIKVYSPYQVYFDDQASSISAINDTGPFDILPRHHRFLTLLSPCELIIAADKGEEKIKISRGIMYVKEDRVTVFLDV